MRHLARRHDITYLSFADPAQTAADLEGMREVASHAASRFRAPIRRKARAASTPTPPRYLVDRVPYAVAKYRSAALSVARVERLLRERRFDAVVCDFLPPVVNLPDALPCPAILFTHNVEAEIWRRHAENATQSGRALPARAAVAADAALRAQAPSPASISCSPFPRRTARRSTALSRRA